MLTDDEQRKIKIQLHRVKKKQKDLYLKHKLQFGRGLLEANEESFNNVFKKIEKLFKEENIPIVITRKVSTELQYSGNYPFLNYGGQEVNIQFRIVPFDKTGKDKMEPKILDELNILIKKEMNYIQKLEEGEVKDAKGTN